MINRRQFCLSSGAALLLPKRIVVAQRASVFLAKIHQNSRGETMPYRFFVPGDYSQQKKYPLVVWLHGSAGRGNDNLKQISGGNTIGSHVWTEPQSQSKRSCLVVAPQCPDNELWATLDTAKPTEQLRLVFELLQDLQRTFSIDAQKLYVTGQSMGGFGTWSAITQYPRMFAAAVPICGGGDENQASKLTRMPIWAFHGEKDEAVSVERSRKMITAIRHSGGLPKYTEYKGAGHVIWDKVFREPELLSWVFEQNRILER
jgi:predicted peptidase